MQNTNQQPKTQNRTDECTDNKITDECENEMIANDAWFPYPDGNYYTTMDALHQILVTDGPYNGMNARAIIQSLMTE